MKKYFSKKDIPGVRYVLWLFLQVSLAFSAFVILIPVFIGLILKYIVPEVSSVLQWIVAVSIGLFPLVFVFRKIIMNKMSSRHRLLSIVAGVVMAALLFIAISFFITPANFFGPGENYRVQIQNEQSVYIVNRHPTIPEGEGFNLYKVHLYVFQTSIASSYRWYEYRGEWVDLYVSDRTNRPDPSYRYNVETKELQRIAE